MNQAESFYKSPGLAQKMLGAPDNPAQVLPEETLVGRLQSGQLDVGFFYSTETVYAKIPALSLPPAITPKAVYTVAILRDAPNRAGARQFVTYLLGSDGQKLLKEYGLSTLQRLAVAGDANAVPQDIKAIVDKAKGRVCSRSPLYARSSRVRRKSYSVLPHSLQSELPQSRGWLEQPGDELPVPNCTRTRRRRYPFGLIAFLTGIKSSPAGSWIWIGADPPSPRHPRHPSGAPQLQRGSSYFGDGHVIHRHLFVM
jgi:hypothetical protein